MNNIQELIHDMGNELGVLQSVLMGINKALKKDLPKKEVMSIVQKGMDRIRDAGELLYDHLTPKVSLFDELGKFEYEGIKIRRHSIEGYDHKMRRSYVRKMLVNIAKNAVEANAKTLIIKINENNIIISDNGDGMKDETIYKLNNGIQITTKENGSGIGTQSIRNTAHKCGFNESEWKKGLVGTILTLSKAA